MIDAECEIDAEGEIDAVRKRIEFLQHSAAARFSKGDASTGEHGLLLGWLIGGLLGFLVARLL